jgi:hypothetical protein
MWYRKYHSSSNCRRRNNTLVRFCLRNTPRDRKFFTTNNKHHHIYAEAGACESTREAVVATVNPLPALPYCCIFKVSFILSNETAIPLSAIPSLTAV